MGTDSISGRHQLSHHIHHIFFPLSQEVDNGDTQLMDRNSSPVLAWPHAIHSWYRPVCWKADIILTDCYANNVSVTSFCHQDSLRASSFCMEIIMSASSWVQRANSSRSIMWMLGEISFCFQWSYSLTDSEKNAPVGWNFSLVWHPSSH